MKEIVLKSTLMLWVACTNYLENNPLVGKDVVQLALYRLTTKLEKVGVNNIGIIHWTDTCYTLQYEHEGLQVVTQISKDEVDSLDVKKDLKL